MIRVDKGRAIALVDCNACYASVQTIFQPWLRQSPIVCLSNNDGNCIARNAPAKALGIKMGQPWHELAPLYRQGKLHVFSANFALIQDISNRVMATLEQLASRMEIYSVDEAWLDASGLGNDLTEWARYVRETVLTTVGMPTGVSIGHTKTQAKIASWAAKKWARQTGNVLDIRDPVRLEKLLRIAPVSEVWGIGSRLTKRLESDMNITTAWQLATANPKLLRHYYGVPVERTARELLGERCFGFEEGPEPRQMIAFTRAFGRRVRDLPSLSSAIASYTAQAAVKLRSQGSLAQCLQVFAHTSPFARTGTPYYGREIVSLPYPTSDSRELVQAAQGALQRLYRDGYDYAKGGVILSQFVQPAHYTGDLFSPGPRPGSDALMRAMDAVNEKMGRGAVRLAREDATKGWKMRQPFLSPCYTTRWEDLPTAT